MDREVTRLENVEVFGSRKDLTFLVNNMCDVTVLFGFVNDSRKCLTVNEIRSSVNWKRMVTKLR
jgi:hypothetical protein